MKPIKGHTYLIEVLYSPIYLATYDGVEKDGKYVVHRDCDVAEYVYDHNIKHEIFDPRFHCLKPEVEKPEVEKQLLRESRNDLAFYIDDEGDYTYFVLGIVKDGEFLDFYYGSGMDQEEFSKLIPEDFVEAAESLYEYHGGDRKTRTVAMGVKALLAAGYKEFKENP